MEIGAKIKEARTRTGLTQEQAAEALGVSRKTISNWENEKTYPDIVSVVKMSDLYAVSLDRLLKDGEGGSEYLDYLGDSTDTVRSRRRLSVLVLLTAYLCVWGGSAGTGPCPAARRRGRAHRPPLRRRGWSAPAGSWPCT